MNPFDYEVYDAPSEAVYTCRACGSERSCTCEVKDCSTPMCCPFGGCPEWRMRR